MADNTNIDLKSLLTNKDDENPSENTNLSEEELTEKSPEEKNPLNINVNSIIKKNLDKKEFDTLGYNESKEIFQNYESNLKVEEKKETIKRPKNKIILIIILILLLVGIAFGLNIKYDFLNNIKEVEKPIQIEIEEKEIIEENDKEEIQVEVGTGEVIEKRSLTKEELEKLKRTIIKTTLNNKYGVETNSGTVETNSGTVETNSGTVETNSGTVETNSGTVETIL